MKESWKKIGNFVSLKDLQREIIYLRKYQQWRKVGIEKGLKWAVPQVAIYFTNSEGKTVEKMWNYTWKLLHEEYKLAKFAFIEFGMRGWTNVSQDAHTYASGNTQRIGDWSLKLWSVDEGEIGVLTQNEYVQDLMTRYYIRQLHENKIPWLTQWSGQELPQNLETGQVYNGINLLTTLNSGGTYFLRKQQVLDLGGTIKFDAVKYPMVWYKWYNFVMVDSKVVSVSFIGGMWLDEWGKIYPSKRVKRGWFLRHFYVYDVEKMTTGLEHMIPEKIEHKQTFDLAFQVLSNVPDDLLSEVNQQDTFYNIFKQFVTSSLQPSRLNRSASKYNHKMIADFAIRFLCAECNLRMPDINSPTEVIESALKVLKSDRTQLIRSAQVASKVVDYILNRPSYEHTD